MLREVIRCRDPGMKTKFLGKVYAWFMKKLEAVGMVGAQEKEEQEIYLNPAKIE